VFKFENEKNSTDGKVIYENGEKIIVKEGMRR
jgi:hypothetical protein